jgi:hypothetical protein
LSLSLIRWAYFSVKLCGAPFIAKFLAAAMLASLPYSKTPKP